MSRGVLGETGATSYIRAVLEVETNPERSPQVEDLMAMVRSVAIQPKVFGAKNTLTRQSYVESPMEELEPGFQYQSTGVVVPAPRLYSEWEIRLYERYHEANPDVDAAISLFKARMSATRLPKGGMRQERPGGAKQPRTRANPLRETLLEIQTSSGYQGQMEVVAEKVVLNEEATKRLARLVYALALQDGPASKAVKEMAEVIRKEVPKIQAGKELARLTLEVPHDGQLIDIMSVETHLNGRHERFLKEINAVPQLPVILPLRPLRWGIKTDD